LALLHFLQILLVALELDLEWAGDGKNGHALLFEDLKASGCVGPGAVDAVEFDAAVAG
jgi:hypothetical protein